MWYFLKTLIKYREYNHSHELLLPSIASSCCIFKSAIAHMSRSCPVSFQLMTESHGATSVTTPAKCGTHLMSNLTLHSHQPGWGFFRATLQTKFSYTIHPTSYVPFTGVKPDLESSLSKSAPSPLLPSLALFQKRSNLPSTFFLASASQRTQTESLANSWCRQ